MALRDLAAFFDDDGLDYPCQPSFFEVGPDGEPKFPDAKACSKTDCETEGRHLHYRVPSPSAQTGLFLTALADLGVKANRGAELSDRDIAALRLDDDKEKTLYQRVLGPVYDEMVADGMKWTALQMFGQDAYLCFAMSQDMADAALTSLGKAPTNRATRRAAAKRTAGSKSRRASTGTATPTRRRASTGSSTSPNEPGAAKTG